MTCPSCRSELRKPFDSEIAIHFPGAENLTTPHVFVSPAVLVCMHCGFTEFRLREEELKQLASGGTRPRSQRFGSN